MNRTILIIFLLVIFFTVLMMFKKFYLGAAQAYVPPIKNVTAGVKVGGSLGTIIVSCNPVNYTFPGWGLIPGASNNPKMQNCGSNNIIVNLDVTNNINWDMLMNATDMTDGAGHMLPVNKIKINSTCGSGTGITTTLLNYSPQYVCTGVGYSDVTNVSFYLDVPPGQYNNTYYGNITIYVNSSQAELDPKNQTWNGPGNTTVKIEKFIDIAWNGVPISFPTLASGRSSNATSSFGWPSNITSSSYTNIFIELYLNGTDLNATSGLALAQGKFMLSRNLSYSNATTLASWPDNIKGLSHVFYPSPGGDFSNWGSLNFGNSTVKNIWWNISIPAGQTPGNYNATVFAKAVDVGQAP